MLLTVIVAVPPATITVNSIQGLQGIQGIQGIQGTQGITGPVAGSANQVVYKDGSNNPTGSGNLTFDGANLYVGGNFTATGEIQGTIFRDYNDTNYYADFANAGTSINSKSIVKTNDSRLVLRDNSIENHATDTDITEIAINYYGYIGGTTRFRDFAIYNGKTSSILRAVGSTGNVLIGSVTATGTASQPLQVTGGAYVSGYLGIGLINPEQKLHVYDSADTVPARIQSNGTDSSIGFRAVSDANSYSTRCGSYQGNGFGIWTGNTIRSVLDNSGNLGIGITNPTSKLEVYTPSYPAAKINSTNTVNSQQYTTLVIGNANSGESSTIGNIYDTVTPSNSYFHITPYGSLEGSSLSIKHSNGNVGINTTNPQYKLEVVGSFAATTKSFVIDHPTKPGRKLRYASLEGPENGVYIRGRSQESIIDLPDYWVGLVDEDSITVHLTPIGNSVTPRVRRVLNNRIEIFFKKFGKIDYYYTIYGERKDVEKLIVEI